jgi:hypothetical protein
LSRVNFSGGGGPRAAVIAAMIDVDEEAIEL